METKLQFHILPQPDETACGPTSLHAVYRFYDDDMPLDQLIDEIPRLKQGGTLGVFLGNHALRRGYRATIYTYNLQVFDPTWFANADVDLPAKLRTQLEAKPGKAKLRVATDGYLDFLALGGRVKFEDLRPNLIRRYLRRGIPLLTGLSATYLYRTPREFGPKDDFDDIQGEPSGHFVVVCGYDSDTGAVLIADPMNPNPAFAEPLYTVPIERLINAILLGILTYDANLLIIEPRKRAKDKGETE